MIQITALTKKYNNKTVVQIDELQIHQGEILGIVGRNGAGKTTLLRLMLDLLKPDSGKVCSKGIPVYGSEHWKPYTGSYIDEGFLIDFLKPLEYFLFIGSLHGLTNDEVTEKLTMQRSLLNTENIPKHKLIRELSSGDRLKVGLMGALLIRPEILILDEPFNFLDPPSQIAMKILLKDLSVQHHTGIVISSHNLQLIADICSRIALMEDGRILRTVVNSSKAMQEIENYFSLQSSN